MFKRATWFTVGLAVGAGGTVVGYVRARQLTRRHVPESVQDAAGRAARRAEDEVVDLAERASGAIDEWRTTAAETRRDRAQAEAVLRHELDRAGL
ncbi:hypothetical protein [Rhabdothermincola salaria]|uniref:hypothetical protein n=1 Tax=Rhabdothermincola salaria TaxID=2903142 RepID=UPI001E4D0D94|nr:hypothetical protein [Rhabdothermincola salaria]MCD9623212.1 hypothetical protein [Rhabdothermincola salaria]